MKCVHCSTPLSRTDWFCPNCKRGVPRRSEARPRWPLAVGAVAGVGLLAGTLLLIGGRRPGPAPAPVAPPAPVAVTIRPTQETDAAEAALQALTVPIPEVTASRQEAQPDPEPEATQPETLAEEPGPRETRIAAGVGEVTVMTDSKVDTYVYLNGGSLLGKAPIQAARIPAGRQTLVFWSPTVGGRSTRQIEMEPGQNVLLIHSVAPSPSFTAGG